MMRLRGSSLLIAAALAVMSPHAAKAEQVQLRSLDTGFVLSGELIRFEDGDYVIRSSVGELTVDGDSVVCEGPGCPSTDVSQTAFGVFGSNAIGAELMPRTDRSLCRHP